MAAEPIEAPKTTETRLTDAERQELLRLRAYRSRREMERMISLGAFGFGVMLAGFGPIGAAAGMILGGLAGYLVVRRGQDATTELPG